MMMNFNAWKMQQRRQKRVVLAPRPLAPAPAPAPAPEPKHIDPELAEVIRISKIVSGRAPAPAPKHIDPELAELIRISKIVSSSVKM